MTAAVKAIEPLLCPFNVVVDTREQHPYHFQGIFGDSKDAQTINGVRHPRPLIVRTVSAALKTGDYSIEGFEDKVAIERKSLGDAFSSFGADRERFERELQRMAEMEFSVVVVEASLGSVLYKPKPEGSGNRWFSGKALIRTVTAWQNRYPTKWWFFPTRDWSERMTFRMLERYWLDKQKELEGAL